MAIDGYGMPAIDFSPLAELGQKYPPQSNTLAALAPAGMRPAGSMAPVFAPEGSGRGSWYSQLPEKGWIDREDKAGSNALGVADSQQGIALPSRSTLGQWFEVQAPNGQTYRLQQTDIGPAKWTGKSIDISAAAGDRMGYSPQNFPTGGNFSWRPAR